MFQSQASESIVYLTASGSPATGVLFGDVDVLIRKADETAFSPKVLATEDWVELGAGFYVIKWSEEDMDTLGLFFYRATGADFDNDVFSSFQVEPAPLGLLADPAKCIISGNIIDLGGSPDQRLAINFRLTNLPKVAGGTSLITSQNIITYADALGNFSIALIREQDVLVEIDGAGIRNQITVPDQSTAQILDLLPPIP